MLENKQCSVVKTINYYEHFALSLGEESSLLHFL